MSVAVRKGGGTAAWLAMAALALAPGAPASAQTRAGTPIANTAALHQDGVATASNGVTLIVAERLDVALARSPDQDRPGSVAVTLVNRGTGDEAFLVAASLAGDGATVGAPTAVAPSGEPAPLADGRTPMLAPGASLVLLVPVAAASGGTVLTITVRAATGSGAPGTAFAGQGDGGGDAVVGPTGAAASVAIALNADPTPTLEKSQSVIAPDGSATAVAGARITYTLVARFAAAATMATFADPIPAGTAYLAGSLVLDGAPLADAGHVAAGQVSVPLGAVAAGTSHSLRFTVVIS